MPDIRDDRFPSNSYTKPVAMKKEKPKVEKVVAGKAVVKKKSIGSKLADAFFVSDGRSIVEAAIFDIVIPAAKDTLCSMVEGAVNMLFYGDRGAPRGRSSNGSKVWVSYDKYYSQRNRREEEVHRRPKSTDIFQPIGFDDEADAREVLSNMVDLIEEFDEASVNDLYGFAGLTEKQDHAKEKYGWDNLSEAKIEATRDGYLLKLPKPKVLD